MGAPKIAEMTVEELRLLVAQVARQTVVEMLGDPDEGLELRDEVKARLEQSLAATERIPARELAVRLGLEW